MIGQSGLPKMNNLAGSNEKRPDDIQAKSSAAKAGAFEKILTPETRPGADAAKPNADGIGRQGQQKAGLDPSLSGARAPETAIPQTQSIPAELVGRQAASSKGDEPPAGPPRDQQTTETVKTELNAGQHPDITGRLQPSTPENSAAETSAAATDPVDVGTNAPPATSLDRLTLQSEKPAAEAESPGVLGAEIAQTGVPGVGRTDAADMTESRPEILPLQGEANARGPKDRPDGSGIEANRLARSPGAVSPADRADAQPSQQVLTLPERGSEPSPAAHGDNAATKSPPVPAADTNALTAAGAADEKKGRAQGEARKTGLTISSAYSDLRSSTSAAGSYSLSDPALAAQSGNPTTIDGSQLKSIAPGSMTQNLTLAAETSFLAQSTPGEPAEALPGSSSTVSSLASSRLDAPTAASAPIAADAKQVIQQINQAIIRMDGTRIEVTLDPVELGRVSLTFITKDDGVTVLVNSERSDTADLLRRNSEQLQRDLSNAGFEDVELDFGQGDGSDAESAPAETFVEVGSTQSLSVSYDANFATSGLDIRI